MTLWSILERTSESWTRQQALLAEGEWMDWGQVRERCAGLSALLTSDGLRPGDRVAYSGVNSSQFFCAYFACAGAGVVLVPLSPLLTVRETCAVLTVAKPTVWIAGAAQAAVVRESALHLDSLERLYWNQDPGGLASASLPETVLTPAPERFANRFVAHECEAEDIAQLYFTSGSTGQPKGVILTHGNVHAHALASTSEFDLASDDTWGHIAPMHHLADAWAVFAVTLAAGQHTFYPQFEANVILRGMQDDGVTISNLVPTMLVRLLAARAAGSPCPDKLRVILSGGAPIAPKTVQELLARFDCNFIGTYGMTETSPFLTLGTLREDQRHLPLAQRALQYARTGRPFETIELEVVNEQGQPVPQDDQSVGEIRVRGASVSPGYWENTQATAEAFREGWLYTSDLAVMDSHGSINIVDRKADIIITGGENVSSIEIEQVLYECSEILEVAVFGVPHPEWGEEVHAAICLKQAETPGRGQLQHDFNSGATPERAAQLRQEFHAHCSRHLAAFKLPHHIHLCSALPKTASGKIRKNKLREEHSAVVPPC